MCRPDFFEVTYEINAWMKTENAVDTEKAKKQWQGLYDLYLKLGYDVHLIDPVDGLPDMVFTANGAIVIDSTVMLPRFKFAERQPETEHFRLWFEANGYPSTHMPTHDFEGEGDALVIGDYILAGWGFRSDIESHQELAELYPDKKVLSIHLVDPRFYHIDTCLTVIDDTTIAYFPPAFDEESQQLLQKTFENVIEVSEEDAQVFGLNTFSDGHNIVMSSATSELAEQYRARGYTVHELDLSEFRKSGGGIKCLTLSLRD